MFCRKCGSKIEGNSKFCSNCGQQVSSDTESKLGKEAQSKNYDEKSKIGIKSINKKKYIISSILILASLLIIGFLVFNSTLT
jgi:uncharacterized membrane protein YvbJ